MGSWSGVRVVVGVTVGGSGSCRSESENRVTSFWLKMYMDVKKSYGPIMGGGWGHSQGWGRGHGWGHGQVGRKDWIG